MLAWAMKALSLGVPRAAKEDRNKCNARAANFLSYVGDNLIQLIKFIKGRTL
jgi:hypothetical protein